MPPAASRERFPDRLIRPQQGAELRLGLRNLYILPTAFGWLWLVCCVVLYLLGINGGSNGPLLLGYLCTGLFLISLHLTQFNLQGLSLHSDGPQPGFAGEPLEYPVRLHSRGYRAAVRLRFTGAAAIDPINLSGTDVTVQVPWLPNQRGLQPPGRLRVWSTAPLGLFHCWSVWEPAPPQLIYPPKLAGPVALVGQGERTSLRQGAASAAGGDEEWRELRPHRIEEGVTRLAWKQLARSGGRFVKTFDDPQPRQGLLAPHPESGWERALSHLSERIWRLSLAGESFGLALPELTIPLGNGRLHRDRCLEALALCRR